jgi:hypothetical protein
LKLSNLTILDNEKLGSGAFATVYKGLLKGQPPSVEMRGSLNFAFDRLDGKSGDDCFVAVKKQHLHADADSRFDAGFFSFFVHFLGFDLGFRKEDFAT